MTQRATTSLSLHYRVKAGQKEEALWRSLRKVSVPLSRSSHTSDTQGPPTACDFSFVGGKRKKSRKLRSPACPASGPNVRSGRKHSGCCLTCLLDRLHKFQQVGVDLICIRGGEAMRQAWVENLLSSLDEHGRSLS